MLRLMRPLLDLCVLSLSNDEASEIKYLYNELLHFDKKTMSYDARPNRSQGHFCSNQDVLVRTCWYHGHEEVGIQWVFKNYSIVN